MAELKRHKDITDLTTDQCRQIANLAWPHPGPKPPKWKVEKITKVRLTIKITAPNVQVRIYYNLNVQVSFPGTQVITCDNQCFIQEKFREWGIVPDIRRSMQP